MLIFHIFQRRRLKSRTSTALARLDLTGGSTNNVAINAAFLAAQAGTPVTMPLVLEAARTEFLKLKRPLSEADFQWSEPTIEAEARAGAAG
jgi:hypothetical protein